MSRPLAPSCGHSGNFRAKSGMIKLGLQASEIKAGMVDKQLGGFCFWLVAEEGLEPPTRGL
jgi:hypothetical protein